MSAPTPPVPAYTVPFSGWSAQDRTTWSADSGTCLIREEKYVQDFPAFATSEEAAKFAARLQKSLYTQKMQTVYTQPVERSGKWGVLASYKYTTGNEVFKVTQLYLSEGGKLRTFTGSFRDGALDPCVNDMLSFVRYLAN
ncbi:hypothetical protein [Deinococcus peraridilitoris]|uniref:hypothetical protein n=1 Tax=Deinococcus peraridilitoris TaxID=432329 RepID=UPI00031710D7|nr:hypothetical protein [Deinococcus peraridilitoris]